MTYLLFYLWNTGSVPPPPFIGPYLCQVSPSDTGFSGQFFATPTYTPLVVGFVYELDGQILYVLFSNGSITGFTPVHEKTATAFNYTANPDIFYTTQILGIFPETYVCGVPPLG